MWGALQVPPVSYTVPRLYGQAWTVQAPATGSSRWSRGHAALLHSQVAIAEVQLCCIAAAVGSHLALSKSNGFVHRDSLSKVHQVCHCGRPAGAYCWHMGSRLPNLGLAQAQPGLLHSEGAHVQKRGQNQEAPPYGV